MTVRKAVNYCEVVLLCRWSVEGAVSTFLHWSSARHLSLAVQLLAQAWLCCISVHSFSNVTTGTRCHGSRWFFVTHLVVLNYMCRVYRAVMLAWVPISIFLYLRHRLNGVGGILFSGCLCVRDRILSLLTRYLGHSTKFTSLVQLGTKMNWLDFEVKGQHNSETMYGQISTLWAIFSPVSGMHGCVLMILITITHYQVHMTLMTI